MAITNIGLRISGTKQRQAGFAPLANAGVLAGGEGENMDRVTLISESPAYVIKHAAEYILYLLVDRRVRSFDADAPGVLSVALTIPSDSQLKDNKSPYTLLKEVYNTFVSNFMEQASDGRNTFRNVDSTDSSIFRDIVANYPLEPRRTAYVAMNPSGISGVVCVSQDNIEDFFRNTQYKEFASFKDVEVGVACHSQVTPGLERLQIPLPPASYEVWVNSNNMGVTMASPTDTYFASAPATKFYTYESVEFSLQELLSAPNGQLLKYNSRISLEPERNRISCILKKVDILYDLIVELKEKEYGCRKAIEEYAKRGNIRLMLDKQDITSALYSQEIWSFKAADVNGKSVSILPSRIVGDYTVDVASPRMDDANRQIVVLVTAGKKANKPFGYGSQHPNKDNGRRIPIGNNPKEDPDRSDEQEQPLQQSEQKKAMIDLKSFCLGTIVGLLLGLAIWFLVGLLGGEEKKETGKKGPMSEELVGDKTPDSEDPSTASLLSEVKPEGGDDQKTIEEDLLNKENDNVTPNGNNKADEYQEIDQQQKAEEKAQEKLRQKELEKQKKEEREKDRQEILALVNKKDLVKCRAHKGWNNLDRNERSAIEAVLNLNQYEGTIKKNVENLQKKRMPFKSLEKVREAQIQIWEWQN